MKAIKIDLPKNSKVAWVVRDIANVTLVRDDGELLRAHKLNKKKQKEYRMAEKSSLEDQVKALQKQFGADMENCERA